MALKGVREGGASSEEDVDSENISLCVLFDCGGSSSVELWRCAWGEAGERK